MLGLFVDKSSHKILIIAYRKKFTTLKIYKKLLKAMHHLKNKARKTAD
jgi:hypothetical protein